MSEIDFHIRTVSHTDRSRLANLIHFGSHIHQHLDWKSPLEWIDRQPYLLLERDGGLAAALACPPDLPEVTWIRLFAVGSIISVNKAWKILWDKTKEELSQKGKYQVDALSLQNWFNVVLEEAQFEHTDNVIVLMCETEGLIPEPKASGIQIRPMLSEDLSKVVNVDNSAFGLEWKNSSESLEIAFQQTSFATVAEHNDEIVGYQYSSSGAMGGHLARLAIRPSNQGQGIGYSLVFDVLNHFKQQAVKHVTVNTQQNNYASLALYKKAGFISTGESYRVYQYILSE